jgi:oligopeptide/dipeptide ABC transporter ATP-binding protein
MKPDVLICDEVVSALDVSIQGQILNLLQEIRKSRGISFLFIAHDLKVACYFCDRIGVMYRGEIMEEADAAGLYKNALHPYTELLFSSVPGFYDKEDNAASRSGEVRPQTEENVSGCAFAARCPYADDRCHKEKPGITEAADKHLVRCFKPLRAQDAP